MKKNQFRLVQRVSLIEITRTKDKKNERDRETRGERERKRDERAREEKFPSIALRLRVIDDDVSGLGEGGALKSSEATPFRPLNIHPLVAGRERYYFFFFFFFEPLESTVPPFAFSLLPGLCRDTKRRRRNWEDKRELKGIEKGKSKNRKSIKKGNLGVHSTDLPTSLSTSLTEWRAKRSNSITVHRQSSANGKDSRFSYGIPRLDNFLAVPALVGPRSFSSTYFSMPCYVVSSPPCWRSSTRR